MASTASNNINSNPAKDLDPVADDNYVRKSADEYENIKVVDDAFFYEAPEVIEQTKKIQKESDAYSLLYKNDKNYYDPASESLKRRSFDESASLSDEVKDFRNRIQKPLSNAIQDFAKSYYWNERKLIDAIYSVLP